VIWSTNGLASMALPFVSLGVMAFVPVSAISYSLQLTSVIRMQKDTLMLADPRGLQYVLHTSGYHFPKRVDARMVIKLLTGRGLTWVSGWYTVPNPFSAKATVTFLPFCRSRPSAPKKNHESCVHGPSVANIFATLSTLCISGEI
jgi:hypothetical protein